MPFDTLRDLWNDKLERLGYISVFEKKHGHRHPNSTDVHATYKVKNLTGYLVKYLAKKGISQERTIPQVPWMKAEMNCEKWKKGKRFKRLLTNEQLLIDGKVWDCSENLKTKIKCDWVIDSKVDKWIRSVAAKLKKEIITNDHCTIIRLTEKTFNKHVTGQFLNRYQAWIRTIRTYQRSQRKPISTIPADPLLPSKSKSHESLHERKKVQGKGKTNELEFRKEKNNQYQVPQLQTSKSKKHTQLAGRQKKKEIREEWQLYKDRKRKRSKEWKLKERSEGEINK
jgi:hypothetical protein